ncbi:hypothetical protein AUJ84_02635 [Candidatus Pacearchaeota archaeon CG1_02_32_132]|nr:MAG: hypothetical protein AUJ84_02635 [Candidatus Pacearchaeota archaeon CG1_02_32_132]
MGRLYGRIESIIEKDILPGSDGVEKFFKEMREEGYEGRETITLVGKEFFGVKKFAGQYLENRGFLVKYTDSLEDAGASEYKIQVETFFKLKTKSGIRERKIRKKLREKFLHHNKILAESIN